MSVMMFTVYDSKAEAYLPPFNMASKGEAIRAFADCVNDNKHSFSRHPADFTLFLLGSFDEASASITALSTPQSLGVAIEYKDNSTVVPYARAFGDTAEFPDNAA